VYTFERERQATKEAVTGQMKVMKDSLASQPVMPGFSPAITTQATLEKLLERLDRIDQRLDGLEKRLQELQPKK
jgi:hypothetical protein